ncbi:hypothetical protein RIU47_10145 [Riemerella anatipestifer]|nr:hypothetical protein [Riemerella anatipestifer]
MTRNISNIQTSVKKCPNYLVVPNNCVNTHTHTHTHTHTDSFVGMRPTI